MAANPSVAPSAVHRGVPRESPRTRPPTTPATADEWLGSRGDIEDWERLRDERDPEDWFTAAIIAVLGVMALATAVAVWMLW